MKTNFQISWIGFKYKLTLYDYRKLISKKLGISANFLVIGPVLITFYKKEKNMAKYYDPDSEYNSNTLNDEFDDNYDREDEEDESEFPEEEDDMYIDEEYEDEDDDYDDDEEDEESF